MKRANEIFLRVGAAYVGSSSVDDPRCGIDKYLIGPAVHLASCRLIAFSHACASRDPRNLMFHVRSRVADTRRRHADPVGRKRDSGISR